MKRLNVLRHAKSSWDHAGLDDFDRPLNDRGWKAARRVGLELSRRDVRIDLCLASPALRVRETLEGVAEGYGELPFSIRFEPTIYLADCETLVELVRDLPDEAKSVLVAGHNPGLAQLTLRLTHDDAQGRRQRVADKFPTGALAAIDLPVQHWTEIEAGSGTLVELMLPRELD